MPYRLSEKQFDSIKTQIELGVPFETIAKLTPCLYETVMSVRKNLQVWGTPRPPKLVPTGSRKLIAPDIEQVRFTYRGGQRADGYNRISWHS
jgi:hypothetical protein